MLNEILDVRTRLFEDLRHIEELEPDVCRRAEQSMKIISDYLASIRKRVAKGRFDSRKDEISFFKEVKPSIFCKLIYFSEVHRMESKRPSGSDATQEESFRKEIGKLETFFFENQEFYSYYRNNQTFLDEKIFVRGNTELQLYSEPFIYDFDPQFSTSHDYKASRILANDMLMKYLEKQLEDLKLKSRFRNNLTEERTCAWTESKIGLVELVYAIQACGCINNGRGDIKEIARLFESVFCIDLGDFYRSFLEIKARQNPTKLLDNMRESLLKKIEEQDE